MYEPGVGTSAELQLFVCAHGAGGNMSDRGMLATVTAPWDMRWIDEADHSFHVLKSSGTTDAAVMEEIATSSDEWLARLPGTGGLD